MRIFWWNGQERPPGGSDIQAGSWLMVIIFPSSHIGDASATSNCLHLQTMYFPAFLLLEHLCELL